MKKLIITAAALMIAVAAHAQGQFAVNFKGGGNDIKFLLPGTTTPVAGTEGYMVEILAGADAASLQPLGAVALSRTSPAAALGYPNPTVASFTLSSGTTALVGYQTFLGSDFATATLKGDLITKQNGGTGPDQTVALVQPPNLPNTVNFGTGTAFAPVPEPTTLALGLLGLGTLLAFRRRQ